MWLLMLLLNGDGALHELRPPQGRHAASNPRGGQSICERSRCRDYDWDREKCTTSSTKWYALHVSTSLQFTQMHICVCQPRRDAVSCAAHARTSKTSGWNSPLITLLTAKACGRTLLAVNMSLARKRNGSTPRLGAKASAARSGVQKRAG